MKKINIIRKTTDFAKIINCRHHFSNHFYIIYIMNKQDKYYRFGISVSKKIGNSVVRHKIKRQIKNIIDNINFNKDFDYVIIVKKEIVDLKYSDKMSNLESLLQKIDGAWKSEKI